MEAREVFPVVWRAEVDAPVGRGSEAADITHGLVLWVTATVPVMVVDPKETTQGEVPCRTVMAPAAEMASLLSVDD
jgi:hypothetical protein